MIIVVGATGVVAWNIRSVLGDRRQVVCLNDGFSVDFPVRMARNPRALLMAIREHSEFLAGRVLSISEVTSLT